MKDLHDKVIDFVEAVKRIGWCTQTILIAHNDEVIVELLTYERKVLDNARQELYLVETIDLFGDRRLYDECAVTIDKQ